jgi:hypothetical protein
MQWNDHKIDYCNITCIATDTEATMIKAARIFIIQAQECNQQFSWHGCIDHLLNLVTKLAFSDLASSEGTMSAARKLIGHFSSYSQDEALLPKNINLVIEKLALQKKCVTGWLYASYKTAV